MNCFENWARWFALDLTKNSDGEYVYFPTKSALKAWNHQQKKIDVIIQCVKDNTADYELDNKIQELLK